MLPVCLKRQEWATTEANASRGENMEDVRNRLGVKSVQWKTEKKALKLH